ncbi:hypothetical protein GQ651_15575 [Alphaproteobacteria bacterium GH1-50]|uniref:Uncharacterized protein n=1 Tax=Kangsaoukella pontilimi TaxID=2691042 RepID=A0A7C9ITZ4_9RHOB|nr:hypothetical protein [Kangsaoukella pontilimi]MXQ09265.1 hypothetical protein [Kangsaoukella pontilimi]
MLQGILGLAVLTAMGTGVATVVLTGSFLFAFLTYVGAGMSVLLSILLAEYFFGDRDSETSLGADDAGLASNG